MFRELCAAILPSTGLPHVLSHWKDVAKSLTERPRKRKRFRFR